MKACSVCGMTFEEIVRTQNIGCSQCYYTFEPEILGIFMKKGISVPYKGSLPKRLKDYQSVLVDRMTVKIKLEEAVAAEDYEKAAFFRDYLKVMEGSADGK